MKNKKGVGQGVRLREVCSKVKGSEAKRSAQQGQEEGRKVSKPNMVRKVMKDMKHV